MHAFINSPLIIGALELSNRLIQGPLAGFSCAPFRDLFYDYKAPAYCVTEMISAHDLLLKHQLDSRYLFRSPRENILCYQIAGSDPLIMAQAAQRVAEFGADIVDINCGCPKTKIRKKGAGSALLTEPQRLLAIVRAVREAITLPLTVKIRIQGGAADRALAQGIEEAGADALIVHGRRWIDDYDRACDLAKIADIKSGVTIPVIANGDICDSDSLSEVFNRTGCDGFMIARAGTGKPWLYQSLLDDQVIETNMAQQTRLLLRHLEALAVLDGEYKAVLQSRSLMPYYFRGLIERSELQPINTMNHLVDIERFLQQLNATPTIYV